MMPRKAVRTMIVVAVVVTGCDAGPEPDATNTAPTNTAPTAPLVAASTTESPEPRATTADSTTVTTTTVVTTVAAPDDPPPVTILTSPSDNGDHPLIEWTPVADATDYLVVVSAPDGVYWSWWGAETAVFLGGTSAAAPPEGASGARLHAPMTVEVFAHGPAGDPLGSSRPSPIAP